MGILKNNLSYFHFPGFSLLPSIYKIGTFQLVHLCTTVEAPFEHCDRSALLQKESDIFLLCIINFHILYNNMLLGDQILVVGTVLLNQGTLLKGLDNKQYICRTGVSQVTGCLSLSKMGEPLSKNPCYCALKRPHQYFCWLPKPTLECYITLVHYAKLHIQFGPVNTY